MKASLIALGLALAWASGARADDAASPASRPDLMDSGKLLATGGVTQVEGAGGSGLVPWALVTGYGTRDSIGANAHYTYVHVSDFELQSGGIGVGLFDRVELSFTHQAFDTQAAGAKLGLGRGFTFHQEVLGAKLRLFGDAVYDQDRLLPQVALGAQYKWNDRSAVLSAIGAKDSEGADFYLAATKLILSESVLFNATIRATKANQFGILGFGGDRSNSYSPQFEGTAALLLTRQVAVGADYRTKPSNLRFAKEDDAFDIFGVYFLNKNVSATLAFLSLGDIATLKNENGVYVSLQVGF